MGIMNYESQLSLSRGPTTVNFAGGAKFSHVAAIAVSTAAGGPTRLLVFNVQCGSINCCKLNVKPG